MRAIVALALIGTGCVMATPPNLFGPTPPLPPPPAYQVAPSPTWGAAAKVELAAAPTTAVAPAAVSNEGRAPEIVLSGQEFGLLQVGYAHSQYPALDELRATLQRQQLFETAARQINRTIRLPRQIDIQLVDCGTVNAFYDPDGHRIIICYELFAYLAETFDPVTKTSEELGNAIAGAAFFTFFHELGHALRDQLDLPLTGREEDAVDQLATLILLDDETRGVEMALAGAQWFLLNAKRQTADADLPFWDEHSFDQQRFYNIACLIYGSAPDRYAELGKSIPAARLARCPAEFKSIKSSWTKLLAPHLRTDGGGDEQVVATTIPGLGADGADGANGDDDATAAGDADDPWSSDDDDDDDSADGAADCDAVIEHILEVYGSSHAALSAAGADDTWAELVQMCETKATDDVRACLLRATDKAALDACEADGGATTAAPVDPIEAAIAKMTTLADRMCACRDTTCSDRVIADIRAMEEPVGKASKAQMDRAMKLAERMAGCQRALLTP